MKQYFYLGHEKLLRLFVQKVLKDAGHEVYVTDSLDDLFVIKDLDSQYVLLDSGFLSKLPSDFFEEKRHYVLLLEDESDSPLLSKFKTILKRPFEMKSLLNF